ncbi:MAG TPA: hypothetical protein VGM51_16485 [Armatimonadota bacterium]|jgi:hypothetical protein
MAGKRAVTAKLRELSKALTPEEMVQLALLLTEEAEKPRFDKKKYAQLVKAVGNLYGKLLLAEDALTAFLVDAGQTNAEINTVISQARMEAERKVMPAPPVKKRGGGRRKKEPVQLGLE